MYYPNSNDWWLDPSAGRFDIRANGGAPLATLNLLGNLGIGATAPSERLVVGTGSGAGQERIVISGGSTPGAAGGINWKSAGTVKAQLEFQLTGTGDSLFDYANSLKIRAGVNGPTAMWLQSDRNVGIGTVNAGEATARLHVLAENGADMTDYLVKMVNQDFTNGQSKGLLIQAGNGALDFPLSVNSRAGTGLLSVRGDGNVGIGTTIPGQALYVYGGSIAVERPVSGAKQGFIIFGGSSQARPATCDSSLQGGLTYDQDSGANNGHFWGCIGTGGGSYQWLQLGGGSLGGSGTANYLPKFSGGTTLTDSLVYDNGSGVGIGTTNPGAAFKLDVNGYMRANGEIDLGMQSGVANPRLYIGDSSAAGDYGMLFWDSAANSLAIKNQNGGDQLVVASGGNVGIGTTAPQTKLDVFGAVNANSPNGFGLGMTPSNPNGDGFFYYAGTGQLGLNANADLRLFTNSTEKMRITSGGNVGIGTTAPQQPLDVNAAAQGGIRLSGLYYPGLWRQEVISSDYRSGNSLISQLSENFVINGNQAGGSFRWYDAAATGGTALAVNLTALTPLMVLNNSGQLGIGTTNPAQKLSVAGAVESTTGGFKFPDGTIQLTAGGGAANGSTRRYFRLTLNSSTSGAQSAVAEFELFDANAGQFIANNMTSASAPSPKSVTVTPATGYTGSAGWKMFDGVGVWPNCHYNDGLMTGAYNTQVVLDLGAGNGIRLTKYRIWTGCYGDAGGTYRPNVWTLESSNDNSAWTVVDSRSGFPPLSSGYVEFNCATVP